MTTLSEIIALNRENIFFIYGLAFFSLGLAIAMQSRRHSRLELARSLKWLAAFGVAHGFYEWGDIFIPMQAAYLSVQWMAILEVLHSALLMTSFLCLLQFGVTLLLPLETPTWAQGRVMSWAHRHVLLLPAGLLLVWAGLLVFIALRYPQHDIHASINALGRYLLAFPGALLAAYGLRQQAAQRIAALNVPAILRNLRLAGGALFVYGLIGGLITPRAPFFPATWLNTAVFNDVVGVPVVVFRSLVALLITIAMIRALEIFEVETLRIIESMEQQQILAAERQRLARDLHDGAIQTVYSAGLLVESAARLVEPDSQAGARLQKAMEVLKAAVSDLRQNLVELKTPPASPLYTKKGEGELGSAPYAGEGKGESAAPQALLQVLQDIAAAPHLRSLVNIHLALALPVDLKLSQQSNTHLAAILNESLANIVRHAQAQNAWIAAGLAQPDNHTLWLTIQDDGIGLRQGVHAGNGLQNMQDRARLIDGNLQFETHPERGACLRLEIPLDKEP